MERQKWEYRFLYEELNNDHPIQLLNEELEDLGNSGWEVIGMAQSLIGKTKIDDEAQNGLVAFGMTILLKRLKPY